MKGWGFGGWMWLDVSVGLVSNTLSLPMSVSFSISLNVQPQSSVSKKVYLSAQKQFDVHCSLTVNKVEKNSEKGKR